MIDQMPGHAGRRPKDRAGRHRILKSWSKGMPVIQMFGTSKFVPVNETYWKNYPSADNYYEGRGGGGRTSSSSSARLKPAA